MLAHSLKPHGYEYQYLAEDARNITLLIILTAVMTAGRD